MVGVVHNPNNWHWVDKNCLPWSKTYMETKIVNDTQVENDSFLIKITNLNSIKGDCDVTQRKGKTRCIYDMVLDFKVILIDTNSEDSTEYSYDMVIPEFIHDQDENDYDFQINGSSNLEFKKHIRSLLVPVLRAKLMNFQKDLINEFDPQIKHNTN